LEDEEANTADLFPSSQYPNPANPDGGWLALNPEFSRDKEDDEST
jgi:hypothetical protein